MQTAQNQYLADKKPVLSLLLSELLNVYEYASILAMDSASKVFSVSRQGINVSDYSMFQKRGVVTRIYHKGKNFEYAFNELSEARIPYILDEIARNLLLLSETIPSGGSRLSYPPPEDAPAVFIKSTSYEIPPQSLTAEELIGMLNEARNASLAVDERLLDVRIALQYQEYGKIFLSKNKDLQQNICWFTGMAIPMAAKGEEIKDYYLSCSGLGGAEMMKTLKETACTASRKALELLDSEPMIPGEYVCVCAPDVTGVIVHEAFGHGVEMDMFVKNRALGAEFIGRQVASELVTMRDSAANIDQTGTYFFDDEGTISSDTLIIDKGILKTGICDALSAQVLGVAPTGNGRRESFERKAYTRMTNTYFMPGTSEPEEMIASVPYGFLLENVNSGMEDPKNWGIQCMVNVAREIKDGKLTGKICSPVVLTGYVPDLLKSISQVSDTFEMNGSGMCGKGYKEFIKVSDGGPYIKAVIRLG